MFLINCPTNRCCTLISVFFSIALSGLWCDSGGGVEASCQHQWVKAPLYGGPACDLPYWMGQASLNIQPCCLPPIIQWRAIFWQRHSESYIPQILPQLTVWNWWFYLSEAERGLVSHPSLTDDFIFQMGADGLLAMWCPSTLLSSANPLSRRQISTQNLFSSLHHFSHWYVAIVSW